GINRGLHHGTVGLADANVLDLKRLIVAVILKWQDAFRGDGRFRLESFANRAFDRAAAIGLIANLDRHVFDDDRFLRIFGGIGLGLGMRGVRRGCGRGGTWLLRCLEARRKNERQEHSCKTNTSNRAGHESLSDLGANLEAILSSVKTVQRNTFAGVSSS